MVELCPTKLFLKSYFYARVVQGCVEHDDCEGEDVARVRVGEDVRIQVAVALRERLHHPVNLLGFSRKSGTSRI
jgi:hypothetical protein